MDCSFSFSNYLSREWFSKQGAGLIDSEPVANPNAEKLFTFNAADSGSQFRTQQTSVGGFMAKPPDRCETMLIVDGAGFLCSRKNR
jgi:hypothetical protein